MKKDKKARKIDGRLIGAFRDVGLTRRELKDVLRNDYTFK